MRTNFQLEKTPVRAGSLPTNGDDDGHSEHGELFKPIRVTVALVVPKKDKSGKEKKPDTVQKQFQLDVLGSTNAIEPSVFWKSTLEALGSGYAATYMPSNSSGQWPCVHTLFSRICGL
jgi:hypothetical protein